MKKRLLLAAVGLCLWSLAAFAQVGTKKIEADARVEKILKEADVKYVIDSEGDFKLYSQTTDGRRQGVWIISNTQNIGSIQVRQIWSIAYVSDEPFPAPLANKFLELNAKSNLGAWMVRKMGGKYVAVFSAQVGADADRYTLLMCMRAVVLHADEIEKELTGKDAY